MMRHGSLSVCVLLGIHVKALIEAIAALRGVHAKKPANLCSCALHPYECIALVGLGCVLCHHSGTLLSVLPPCICGTSVYCVRECTLQLMVCMVPCERKRIMS